MSTMRIVIVGAGRVGTQLAKSLIQEKHDVSMIESDEERARHASNRLDCLVIHDEGNNLKTLEESGIAKADALVCVTDSDELNMIICGLAASRYGDRPNGKKLLKIARVRNDDYMQLSKSADRQVLGIDLFVHPNMEAARSIINTIEHGVLGDIVSFPDTSYELGSVNVAAGSAFDGLMLKNYHGLAAHESLVTLVERDGEVLLPSGDTALAQGDRVYILADKNNLPKIYSLAGTAEMPIRRIGIVGGGKLGSLIACGLINGLPADEQLLSGKQAKGEAKNGKNSGKPLFGFPLFKKLLLRNSKRLVIIEQDYNLCKDLAARFPEALILNEDISDENFVNEEHLDDLDLLVTTTNNQELNIIAAVYLKTRGVRRTIATVTGLGYAAIARHLGIDVVMPMSMVVADSILCHLVGKGLKEVRRLGDGAIDITEVEIGEGAPIAGMPIHHFKLSEGGLLMLARRDGCSFIPRGDYVFNQGDRVVIIAKSGSQAEIEKYFGIND